jgi:hypothetical protein
MIAPEPPLDEAERRWRPSDVNGVPGAAGMTRADCGSGSMVASRLYGVQVTGATADSRARDPVGWS